MAGEMTKNGAAVLVVSSTPDFIAESLEDHGYTVLAQAALDVDAGDRELLKQLEQGLELLTARTAVDAGKLAVIGTGRGGTLAFMLGCVSSRVAAVITDGAPIIYAGLSPERPMQPLEMALNLSCPLLSFFGEESETVSALDVTRMEEVLSQFFRTFDIVTHPGSESALAEPSELGRESLQRVASFLSEALELE